MSGSSISPTFQLEAATAQGARLIRTGQAPEPELRRREIQGRGVQAFDRTDLALGAQNSTFATI
jgi:hypothetical protein